MQLIQLADQLTLLPQYLQDHRLAARATTHPFHRFLQATPLVTIAVHLTPV